MTRRIFRSICLVALAVLAAALIIIMGALYDYFTQVQQTQLRTEIMLAAQAVDDEGIVYLAELADLDCRITWIAADGEVLYDSAHQPEAMENHLEREEINEALEKGYGESSRYSATLMEQSVYAAQRLSDGTILRMSVSRQTAVMLALGMARPICMVIAVALLLSLLLAHRLSRRIVQPLNELDLDNPVAEGVYEELSPLVRRIGSQQRQLQGQATELKKKQREFETVIRNMNEGLVLMNQHGIVLTMNEAAARLMGLTRPMIGINFLSLDRSEGMDGMIDSALQGNHSEYTATLAGKVYQIDASPVKSGGRISGLVLLMFDITEKQRSEAQRREFTANVSHELKTPLHAISGYAELLKSGLVPVQDVGEFSGRIYTETQRMVRLVEDILKLSHLDEAVGDFRREQIDLYALASGIARELTPAAQKRQVSLMLSGESSTLETVPHLAGAIITNLCTNAIKYNKPGGSVHIELRNSEKEVILTVSDTGIGIAPEHQERIFERFYRVDKSHSKAVGGTGLGLSIVKHAALILDAKIDLESTVGQGTVITVHFPQ